MTALVYILLCLIWGSTWMAIKLGLQDSPPMYTLLLRFILATVIVNLIVMFRGLKYPRTLQAWWRLGYPGLLMFSTTYICTYQAERFISSALTSVLYSSIPLFVAVYSIWMLKEERLSLRAWVGLLTGLAGIVLISYEQLGRSNALFLGTMLALTGAGASAFATVLLKKRHGMKMDVLLSVGVQMLFGLIPILIITPLVEDWSAMNFSSLTVGSILYLSLIGTVVAFIGYYWLMTRLRAVVISLTAFIIPLVAICIGVLIFDEQFRGMMIPGTMLILLGVLLVVIKRPTKKTTPRTVVSG